MQRTNISWVLDPDGQPGWTWNPIVGCSPASSGCRSCWAARMAATRLAHLPDYRGLATIKRIAQPPAAVSTAERATWTGEVRFLPNRLDEPLRRSKPSTIAVALMGDLFHEKVTNEQIAAVFGVMAACPQHTFWLLTKRARRMREWFAWAANTAATPSDCDVLMQMWTRQWLGEEFPSRPHPDKGPYHSCPWPLPNVRIGVSIEDRSSLHRLDDLRDTPAAFRYISGEPLLEDLDQFDLTSIDLVIVGCESGSSARPMEHAWAVSIQQQCQSAGVPFFFKQEMVNGKLCHEPTIDGQTWRQLPEVRR